MKSLSSLIMLLAVFANAYTLADAERAYVTKDWATAKAAYSAVCPTLSGTDQVSCVYWHSLALSQTGKAEDFKAAGKKLDSLISKVSPQDSLYSDLVMTRAQFEIYLKKYSKARASLRHSVETARNAKNPAFVQVCNILQNVDKSKETAELCAAISEGSVVAVLVDSTVTDSVVVKDEPAKVDSLKQDTVKHEVPKQDAVVQVPVKQDTIKQDLVIQDTVVQNPAKPDSAVAAIDSSSAPVVEQKVEPAMVPAAEKETYALQVGAFSKKENAEMLVAALKSRDIEVRIVERTSVDRVLYLVRTKDFGSRQEAMKFGNDVLLPLKMEFSPVKNP